MREQESRTYMMLGGEAIKRLKNSHIVLFGLGGVGSYTAEALARAGVGEITLVDGDKVAESNINRQLVALHSTKGRFKTDVVKERISDIDPDIVVHSYPLFYSAENCEEIKFDRVTYVADAIDTVTSKLLLIERAREKNIPVISCMGAGNKLDPTQFEVAEIEKTSVCPLARVVRGELKKRGITGVKAVFSKEQPVQLREKIGEDGRKKTPGSISFVPPVAGFIMAGEIIKDVAGID